MADTQQPGDDTAPAASESPARRVGFWLGLVLFVGLLSCPPPEGMHRAARAQFADEIRARAAARIDAGRNAGTPLDSDTHAQIQERVVAEKANVMMAAAAVTALVACWWITVALPIPVTSLLPLVLFPLVGVVPIKQAAVPYANPNVFLFMGGFIIALGIEHWNLHRRIALHIVRVVGTSPATIVLGFMLASALLSMWISNTATALMMLPIGLAIISSMSELGGNADPKRQANFAAALMLGIAYAASIGGIATPIGTPPNISFAGQMSTLFPDAPKISFGQWMIVSVPLVVVFLPTAWLVLVRLTCPVGRSRVVVTRDVVARDLKSLGAMARPERLVLCVFAATALLWMTRSIPMTDPNHPGEVVNYGWSGLLERLLTPSDGGASLFQAAHINDATVALAMAVLLFIIPSGRKPTPDDPAIGPRERLMDWDTAKRLPWGILLLFGGGFSIAVGFKAGGLSYYCGQLFAGTEFTSPILVILCICLLMTFLTEITSNTATTEVMLPILSGVAIAMEINPLILMLPATFSASCAFMLPVATPPNAIIFGSGHVDMGRMVRSGIILNLIGVALITTIFYFIAMPILGIDPNAAPHWTK